MPTQHAIPRGRLMTTSESWGVNGHTTRYSYPWFCGFGWCPSGWGLQETEISATLWAHGTREEFYFLLYLCLLRSSLIRHWVKGDSVTRSGQRRLSPQQPWRNLLPTWPTLSTDEVHFAFFLSWLKEHGKNLMPWSQWSKLKYTTLHLNGIKQRYL